MFTLTTDYEKKDRKTRWRNSKWYYSTILSI